VRPERPDVEPPADPSEEERPEAGAAGTPENGPDQNWDEYEPL